MLKSLIAAACGLLLVSTASAQPVRVAFIDALGGPFANVGSIALRHFEFAADRINAAGGVAGGKTVEIVGYDNELSPEKSIMLLKRAIDNGIQYIAQGNGSAVAFALTDAISKHNQRNPEQPVLYLNYASVDPALTNDRCSYWHFRFDADVDMKMQALTDFIAANSSARKVYLINQDYTLGHSAAAAAKLMLKEKAAKVALVGDDLVPLAKVKDFSPYVSKMQLAGADSVLTSNWGNDLTLLIKAANDSGFKGTFYTYYGGGLGTPTALGASGRGTIQVSEWHRNVDSPEIDKLADEFQRRYKADYYYYRVGLMMDMVARAMNAGGSADPRQVAQRLENMRMQTPLGEVYMRADNHQLIQPLYISAFSDGLKHDVEGTGFGFASKAVVPVDRTVLPTTCQMKRPS